MLLLPRVRGHNGFHQLSDRMLALLLCLDGEVLRTALVCISKTTGESFPDPPTHAGPPKINH